MDKKALQQAQMEAKERLKAMGLLQEVEKEAEPSQREFFKEELAKKDLKIQELTNDLIELGEKLVLIQQELEAYKAPRVEPAAVVEKEAEKASKKK